MLRVLIILSVLVSAVAPAAMAQETLREFDNPTERTRYYELLEKLRCLVCQNESLASSQADLAQDMRDEVYRLVVTEDRTSEAAVNYLVQRYGDFVLYQPPVKPTTWLLWFGPLLMLAGGIIFAALIIRRRRSAPEATLSPADRERARRLLHGDNEERR